ncbi:PLP-dependent cysteine synthase family protein [Leucobacter tenebrionis]|nr:PLP-dependent cysteine synthase family protein [Leucobacter tenebrionis]
MDAPRTNTHRAWTREALRRIEAETQQSVRTPLIKLPLPQFRNVTVYAKDESVHVTGSLKHRLARSLFVQALCNGEIGPDTVIIEASSGSTAVSEAYFAALIGLPFIAVVPAHTSAEKLRMIEHYGGRCHTVEEASAVTTEAQRLATECGGYFIDQFTNAATATDWRTANIAEEVHEQLRLSENPVPSWVVVGAGTGGTSTCFARHARYRGYDTRVAVVDPDGSAFFEGWRQNDRSVRTTTPSRIEGIGRTQVEPSFYPELIDRMIHVPDAASIATMRWFSRLLGRRVGASTGTNLWGTLLLAQELEQSGEATSLVTLICDSGDRYVSTYYNDDWLTTQGIDVRTYASMLTEFEGAGQLKRTDTSDCTVSAAE